MLPDWIELCALFAAHRVEFLLVGGHAVIAHGYPRLTKDMDLWVRPTRDNGRRVFAALAEFGTPLEPFAAERFEELSAMIVLGRDPFRVDLLTDSRAWSSRRRGSVAHSLRSRG
jgi:hypothetical protein